MKFQAFGAYGWLVDWWCGLAKGFGHVLLATFDPLSEK